MIHIRKIDKSEKSVINDIVEIHLETFKGFFLTFMGRGFLRQMYSSYCTHEMSDILVAFESNGAPVGFVAYSGNMSGLYKHMIKTRLIPFAWFSAAAFFRRPAAFMRIVRAFLKPGESKRKENYVELASIGVDPAIKSKGVGSLLIDALKKEVDFSEYAYISLETDAVDNDGANHFYQKNGFVLEREYETHEGRKMNEYRYSESEM